MALPKDLREFDDTSKTREWLHANTIEALTNRFPMEDDEYKLELSNVRIDKKPSFGLARQKKALMHNDQLRVPIKGHWKLMHKPSGEVLDERDETVLNLPYLTDRGTMIHKGNEYSSVSQSRLKPGVYSRRKKSGELESFFNVKPGTGRSFRVWLEPQTGVFKVNIGQANIPLYPMLNALGVKDDDLIKRWGPDILAKNQSVRSSQALEKLYSKFTGKKSEEALSESERRQLLKDALSSAELDSESVARTLGIQQKNVTPDVMLRATQKLLGISRGEEKTDNRDAPMFSNILSVEDSIKDRIDKDAGNLGRSLLFKARRDRSLKRVKPGALDPYASGYLLGSRLTGARLTMPLEETNPLALLEQMHRVTKLGEGGISSADAITDDARNVNIGQLGFIDPITGPEDTKIGIDTRVAYRTFKGKDRQMYGEFKDVRNGKNVYLRPEDVDGKVVAFPGEMDKEGDMATAVIDGVTREVPKSKVDIEVPSLAHMFSSHVNLNPMPTSVQAGRQFYGAKFWSQYMPQSEGEAPLVDSAIPGTDETFSQHFGKRVGTIKADKAAVVSRITKNKVIMKDEDGETHEVDLVQDFPYNRISGVSYRPAVKAGDTVKSGDVVARSNFVDDNNSLRLGKNLNIAVIPYRGLSFEDGIVISEDAAKKLSTNRLYGYDTEAKHGIELGKSKYAGLFPDRFSDKQFEKLDKDGIVKPGTTLEKGDPVILATGPKLLSSEDMQLGRLHKALRNAYTDKALVWEHEYPGVVTDAAKTRAGAKVNVKADVPVQVADKLSPRWGLKGVVSKIIPDDRMPRNASTNEPFDVLLNPMTILSRVAAGSLAEMQLGKLAKIKGKQFKLPHTPPKEGWTAWAQKQLKEAGVEEKETVFDPELGRNLNKPVATGNMYWMAFHHLAEKKLSDRSSTGFGYTMDELPAKGGLETQQAKRMSNMDINALLSHGATDVIRDAQVIRGARNDDLWKALKLGRPLPEPKTPFVYNKFLNLLKAGGVNLSEKGDVLKLLPMMDEDVDRLSHGAIKSSAMVNDSFEPVAGGLFDPGKTGGAVGKNWTHVELNEPMPNPVFEEPIRRLLGLKQQEFKDVIAGRKELNGKSGGQAMRDALAAIDIDKELAAQRANIHKYRGSKRDDAVKKLGYLTSSKKQGIHPSKWMINKIPVLPPIFRPVGKLGDITLSADLNELYRDLIEVNNSIGDLRKDVPESALQDEKDTLYNAVKAVTGLGDPITPEGRSRRLKGAIKTITGDSPKRGMFQNKVISKTVDLVGRAVVTPDPNLDMDSVGIPEESAWEVYKDFVLRRLVRQNIPTHKALNMIKDRDATARAALDDEMRYRPVLMDRAPTWHKFNIMAFHPHIVEGDSMRVSPLVTKGFNMDFDGDCVDNQVLTTISSYDLENNYKKLSHNIVPEAILQSMKNKKIVPILEDGYKVIMVDLEDFPHGELAGKKAGAKGDILLYHALPGTKVVALDETTHKPVWADVKYYSKHLQREIEIVKLRNKRETYTDDDPRAVYGIDPSADDICYTRCTPTEAVDKKIAVPIVKETFPTLCDSDAVTSIPVHDSEGNTVYTIELNRDNGYLLGALCGDGWWDHRTYDRMGVFPGKYIYLADLKGHVAAKVKSVLCDLLGPVKSCSQAVYKTADNGRYGDSVKHTFWSDNMSVKHTFWSDNMVDLVNLLDDALGGARTEESAGSASKNLPAWAFMAPREFRIGMLCGLLDTDGSVSVSNGKSKPQLLLSFTSTSLRLCREVSMLLKSVGVDASVTWSKTTTGGNDSWIVTISTRDAKRLNIFDGLQDVEKSALYATTFVKLDHCKNGSDNIVFPDCVSSVLKPKLEAPKKAISAADKAKRAIYMNVRSGMRNKLIGRAQAIEALQACAEREDECFHAYSRALNWLEAQVGGNVKFCKDDADILRRGIRAVAPSYGDRARYEEGLKIVSRLNTPLRKGELTRKTIDGLKEYLNKTYRIELDKVAVQPAVRKWMDMIVDNTVVSWSTVESVDCTHKAEDGYDLTVPGYETFMTSDGIILSNTVNFHVPVADDAVEQAKDKMLPSKNLFSLTDLKSPRYTPQQEMALGLYLLTRKPTDKKPAVFATVKEAKAAYRRGDIDANDPIEILEEV